MQTCLQQGTHLELTYHSINVKIEKLYSMHYREDTNVALLICLSTYTYTH